MALLKEVLDKYEKAHSVSEDERIFEEGKIYANNNVDIAICTKLTSASAYFEGVKTNSACNTKYHNQRLGYYKGCTNRGDFEA